MLVTYGRRCPRGHLPVFSVADEQEARDLLVLACPTDRTTGAYFAPELVQEQTLENLYAFGDRLKRLHDEHLAPHGRCRCAPSERHPEAGS